MKIRLMLILMLSAVSPVAITAMQQNNALDHCNQCINARAAECRTCLDSTTQDTGACVLVSILYPCYIFRIRPIFTADNRIRLPDQTTHGHHHLANIIACVRSMQ